MRMKRILIAALVLSSLAFFVSCQKSGVYMPKNKISKVWYEAEHLFVNLFDSTEYRSSTAKYQREGWTWNGKFLGERTLFRANGDIRMNYVYEYNKKNKVIGITSNLPSEKKTRIRFVYDDDTKLLKEIRYFTEAFPENDSPYKKLEFTYDGKVLASVKETIKGISPKSCSEDDGSLLSLLVSEEMAESIVANEIRSKAAGDQINEYVFEWSKDNISTVKITTTIGNISSEKKISYTYDNKKNPQIGRVMGYVEDGGIDYVICSKNNPVTCKYEGADGNEIYSEEIQYTYDGKVPTEKIVKRTEKTASSMSVTEEKITYEYED